MQHCQKKKQNKKKREKLLHFPGLVHKLTIRTSIVSISPTGLRWQEAVRVTAERLIWAPAAPPNHSPEAAESLGSGVGRGANLGLGLD